MNSIYRNKNFRKGVLVLLDIIAVSLSSIIALLLRFDIQSIPPFYLHGALKSMIIYWIATVVVMGMFKLYDRVWTYASFSEFFAILKASALLEAIFVTYHMVTGVAMPRSYYFIQLFTMLMMFIAIRFAKIVIASLDSTQKRNAPKKNIMIVGAGSAASILIKELRRSDAGVDVVCAIDDNINKKNKYILNVPIVGTRNDIGKTIGKYNIHEIVIAMPSAMQEDLSEIIQLCQKTGKMVKILPSMAKTLNNSVVNEIRPVSYEDLLGREPIKVNQEGLSEFIEDKVVMVTGGGGSIGSELCRQIISYNPSKLIIFDIYENNAYEIQMELERHHPDRNISTLIGSIRDYDRMEAVFKKYRPQIIYHAAAHKHVPLMEKSPNEAIKNNCLGTLNLAKLADKYRVENFILISTDKAVRPTNIMGATKRMCEMIIQTYANRSKHTQFAAVRFGNVLGSNGSVIPLFLKQIEEGGPVTVTHKEITRFFMTIPEAVSLVLQASLFAKGGEIFVLDMGKPVKIYQLAENLIKMKGLTPNEDINIEIVGLRPGEKLYEEILMDEEGLDKTENNMIYIGKPLKFNEEKFLRNLDALIEESMKNGRGIKEMAEEVCGTYTITDN